MELLTKRGMTFDGTDPLLPLRWNVVDVGGAVDMRLTSKRTAARRPSSLSAPMAGYRSKWP